MQTRWLVSTAVAVTGHLVMVSAVASPLAGINPAAITRPHLMLAQSGEPPAPVTDRLRRLRNHRAILESALAPRQAIPAQPPEPQSRSLQAPEPTVSRPRESTEEVLPPEDPDVASEAGGQISCDAAAAVVEDYGFSEVQATDCSGELYTFSATRDGTAYSLAISAAEGEIAEVCRQ